jgi:arylsulfatase A-like enzyme
MRRRLCLVLVALALVATGGLIQWRNRRPPDVFVYVIDALRADHVGCYGYPRSTTPNIDAFAAEATLYERAHTPATWTRPAVASLLTGLHPNVHGAITGEGGLAEWPVLLPEALRSAGYAPYSILANCTITAEWGFGQGYERVIGGTKAVPNGRPETGGGAWQVDAGWVIGQARKLIGEREDDAPLFLYLHTIEPHAPYQAGPKAVARFDRGIEGRCDGSGGALWKLDERRHGLSDDDMAHLVDCYDAEVWEADRWFGEFIAMLKEAGRYEHAMIVLVGDHGEAFGEHGTLQHGNTLNQEELRVPLLLRYPRGWGAGKRVAARVSLLDLFPTVVGVAKAQVTLPYELTGRDLRPLVRRDDALGPRPLFAEVCTGASSECHLVGVIDAEGYKLVRDVSAVSERPSTKASRGLWDTEKDRRELVDLEEMLPEQAARCDALLSQWRQTQAARRAALSDEGGQRLPVTDEMRREMKALGYLR